MSKLKSQLIQRSKSSWPFRFRNVITFVHFNIFILVVSHPKTGCVGFAVCPIVQSRSQHWRQGQDSPTANTPLRSALQDKSNVEIEWYPWYLFWYVLVAEPANKSLLTRTPLLPENQSWFHNNDKNHEYFHPFIKLWHFTWQIYIYIYTQNKNIKIVGIKYYKLNSITNTFSCLPRVSYTSNNNIKIVGLNYKQNPIVYLWTNFFNKQMPINHLMQSKFKFKHFNMYQIITDS